VLALRAFGRLVVDAHLPEPDPTRQSFEEPVALRQHAQGSGRARRQQAEVAGVFGDRVARTPIDDGVENADRDAARERLVGAVCLGRIDDVVALVEPMRDQGLDQGRRMLAVAIHEQERAVARVVEAGEQRGLLAEIARQRHHLHVEDIGGQCARDRQGIVRAAVVDIDDLAGKLARLPQSRRDLGEPRVQVAQVFAFVEHRHDQRQPGGGTLSGTTPAFCDTPVSCDCHAPAGVGSGRISPAGPMLYSSIMHFCRLPHDRRGVGGGQQTC
jgi:hypothetical protein